MMKHQNQLLLQMNNISKSFILNDKRTITALDNIHLNIYQNQFVCLLGPSGCGKSTLLRIIANLETKSSGSIHFHHHTPHNKANQIGMVFQEYSLFPWLNILDNVAFGLKIAKIPKKDRQNISLEFLSLVDMDKFAFSLPHELSGGMRQRVAIARALATNPQILLMDEPFGALDAYTRILLQERLLKLIDDQLKTVLFVTHSVDEAVYLADRIVIMSAHPGKIMQDIKVPLSFPRNRADPEYGQLVTALLKIMCETNQPE